MSCYAMRGLFNPTYYNYGGQNISYVEKRNHRVYLNLVKPWPLDHLKFMETNYPMDKPTKKKFDKPKMRSVQNLKDDKINETQARFFREVHEKEDKKLKSLLFQAPICLPKQKAYREKNMDQMMMFLNPKSDPYGYKETKLRSQLWRKGQSMASGLGHKSKKELDMIETFNIWNKGDQGQLSEILCKIQQKYKCEHIPSISKLLCHIQKKYQNLTIEDIQNIYYESLQKKQQF